MHDAETPSSIRAPFQWRSAVSLPEMRSSVGACLHLPRCRLTGSQSVFSYRAAAAWNSLATDVIPVRSLSTQFLCCFSIVRCRSRSAKGSLSVFSRDILNPCLTHVCLQFNQIFIHLCSSSRSSSAVSFNVFCKLDDEFLKRFVVVRLLMDLNKHQIK